MRLGRTILTAARANPWTFSPASRVRTADGPGSTKVHERTPSPAQTNRCSDRLGAVPRQYRPVALDQKVDECPHLGREVAALRVDGVDGGALVDGEVGEQRHQPAGGEMGMARKLPPTRCRGPGAAARTGRRRCRCGNCRAPVRASPFRPAPGTASGSACRDGRTGCSCARPEPRGGSAWPWVGGWRGRCVWCEPRASRSVPVPVGSQDRSPARRRRPGGRKKASCSSTSG